jgi:BirA family biotin operon repressor/biotin-[acetyl-CoA-carboxylase] ligase
MQNYTHRNFTIHQFEELKSTNSHAFELARLGQIFDREIIVAASQKSGRGRKDRKWESPIGNLYFSLVLQPKTALEKIPQISFLAIVALRLAIEKIAPQNSVKNKWPNDLLIDEKKIAGILLESEMQNNEARFVILGIGVNLISNPENTIFPAGNLKNFGIKISPENLLKNFLDEFEKIYQNWLDYGFAGVRKLWLKEAFRLQEKISVKLDEKAIEGIFEDLDLEGNLLLKSGGKTIKITTADIS